MLEALLRRGRGVLGLLLAERGPVLEAGKAGSKTGAPDAISSSACTASTASSWALHSLNSHALCSQFSSKSRLMLGSSAAWSQIPSVMLWEVLLILQAKKLQLGSLYT